MSNVKDTDKRMSTIYAIRCKENGRIYIGISFDPRNRINTHFAELAKGEKKSTHYGNMRLWQEDYNTYGRDAFEAYIMEENIPASKRREKESEYIEKYRSAEKGKGYNQLTEKNYKYKHEIIYGLPPMNNGE